MLLPRTVAGALAVFVVALLPSHANSRTRRVAVDAEPETSKDTSGQLAHAEPVELDAGPVVVAGESQSVGLPQSGRLLHASQLEASPFVRFKAGTSIRERYATDEMVALLEHAARHVDRIVPGAALTLGDMSRRRGGFLFPHRSHRSGRDADILFFGIHVKGQPAKLDTFVSYRGDGTGQQGAQIYLFDAKRNWELVAYLLHNPIAEVQQIYVAPHIRALLLAEARHRGEPAWLIDKAERALMERGGHHDDHMHVRIGCADDDRRCRELPGW